MLRRALTAALAVLTGCVTWASPGAVPFESPTPLASELHCDSNSPYYSPLYYRELVDFVDATGLLGSGGKGSLEVVFSTESYSTPLTWINGLFHGLSLGVIPDYASFDYQFLGRLEVDGFVYESYRDVEVNAISWVFPGFIFSGIGMRDDGHESGVNGLARELARKHSEGIGLPPVCTIPPPTNCAKCDTSETLAESPNPQALFALIVSAYEQRALSRAQEDAEGAISDWLWLASKERTAAERVWAKGLRSVFERRSKTRLEAYDLRLATQDLRWLREFGSDTAEALAMGIGEAHIGVAEASSNRGNPGGAIDHYKAARSVVPALARRVDPPLAIAYRELGDYYTDRREYEYAIDSYRSAQRLGTGLDVSGQLASASRAMEQERLRNEERERRRIRRAEAKAERQRAEEAEWYVDDRDRDSSLNWDFTYVNPLQNEIDEFERRMGGITSEGARLRAAQGAGSESGAARRRSNDSEEFRSNDSQERHYEESEPEAERQRTQRPANRFVYATLELPLEHQRWLPTAWDKEKSEADRLAKATLRDNLYTFCSKRGWEMVDSSVVIDETVFDTKVIRGEPYYKARSSGRVVIRASSQDIEDGSARSMSSMQATGFVSER